MAAGFILQISAASCGPRPTLDWATMEHADWSRGGIPRWDFGPLEREVEVRRGRQTLIGYPAIIDRQTSVDLQLAGSLETARSVKPARACGGCTCWLAGKNWPRICSGCRISID